MKKVLALVLAVSISLSLSAGTVDMTVTVENTETFSLDGVEHEITLKYIDGGAAIKLDDKETALGEELNEGDSFSNNGVKVTASKVVYSSSDKSYLNFTAEKVVPDICKDSNYDCGAPEDPDSDGLYEDLNGDQSIDNTDVVTLGVNLPAKGFSGLEVYDFDEDTAQGIDYRDVKKLSEEASPNDPLGFQKNDGDWRDDAGHYQAFTLDVDEDSYIGIDDVIAHWNEQKTKFGEYNPSDKPEALMYDYNCDKAVNRTDTNLLFRYVHNYGDYRIGEDIQDYDGAGCDYNEDGTPYHHMEEEDIRFIQLDQVQNVTEGESLNVSSAGVIEIVNTGRMNMSQPVLSVSHRGQYGTNDFRVSDEPVQLSSYSNYQIDVCGVYEDGKAPVIVSDSMSCEDVKKETEITCQDIQNTDITSADTNDDGVIGEDEVRKATEDWRSGEISNERLELIVTSWEKSCTLEKDLDTDKNAVNIELNRGWNMVSVPEGKSSNLESKCDLKEFKGKPFWSLSGEESGWDISEVMSNSLKGYMVYAKSSCETSLIPKPVDPSNSLQLSEGWNTISLPEESSLSSLAPGCGFEGAAWTLDPEFMEWKEKSVDENLSPSKGYYVKTESQCTISY